MQIGEGFAGDGANAAHVNTMLGAKNGPVGAAWATALATPRAGHAPFVVVVRPNVPVKPMTLFVNKATVDPTRTSATRTLTWGAAQAGVAAGVMAAHRKGVIAAAERRRPRARSPRCGWIPTPTTRSGVREQRRGDARRACRRARRPADLGRPCSTRASRRTHTSAREHDARAGRARDARRDRRTCRAAS